MQDEYAAWANGEVDQVEREIDAVLTNDDARDRAMDAVWLITVAVYAGLKEPDVLGSVCAALVRFAAVLDLGRLGDTDEERDQVVERSKAVWRVLQTYTVRLAFLVALSPVGRPE